MARRVGVTLIEVLVSIFIMGVGLLALLTLFPLGALTMAQAIRDDRCAQAAANAEAIAVLRDLRTNSAVTGPFLSSPGQSLPSLNVAPGGLEGPSYPVYLDPFGVLGAGSNLPLGRITGGTFPTPGIARRTVTFANTFPTALQWFSLHDDMEFTADGLPKRLGTEIQREPRYTGS